VSSISSKKRTKHVNLRYHCSKVEFIRSFFGRIHSFTVCFRVLLTFSASKWQLKSFWVLIYITTFSNCYSKIQYKFEFNQYEGSIGILIWSFDKQSPKCKKRWQIKVEIWRANSLTSQFWLLSCFCSEIVG
jgi:hypothetical protein